MAKVKVFLTWSGERSKQVAEALRSWLPEVIQNLEPWMSDSDIDKGSRWAGEISMQLEESKIGIICLTPENLTAPWINFEASALSKLTGSYVCTFLFHVGSAQVEYPLAQFQHTKAEKEDTRKLLHTLNQRVPDPLTDERLDRIFEKWWPEIEAILSNIPKTVSLQPAKRSVDELCEEILDTVRLHTQAQSVNAEVLREILVLLNKARQSPYYRSIADIPTDLPDSLKPGLFGFGSASTTDPSLPLRQSLYSFGTPTPPKKAPPEGNPT